MEEKVNLLISILQQLNKQLNQLGLTKLSDSISLACISLKSHDLIGLDIILTSFSNSNIQREIKNCKIYDTVVRVIELTKDIKEDFNNDIVPLTKAEELFLNISYNKFFDISEEIYSPEFWRQTPQYRLSKISQAFSIYGEILTYEPIQGVLNWMSKYRPPMESEISGPLFKFIRNILAHFPFYDSWDDIWISKDLVNWRTQGQSIDKFLKKYSGLPAVKYRFKENTKPSFTFITISFPEKYDSEKIYLKDIIKEEEGVKFALVMMRKVLNTQIESMIETTTTH